MKRLIFILFCLITIFAKAQTIQYLGGPTTQIYIRGQLRIDTVVYLPLRDTTFTPSQVGAFIVKGAVPYLWTGLRWLQMSTGSPVWGTLSGTLSDQIDLQNALNAKQNTLTPGYGIKIATNTILFDSATIRKVDTITRLNDSTLNFTINGVSHSVLLRGTAAGGITSLVLNVPGTPFIDSVIFTNAGGHWSGNLILASQSANTVWSGPAVGSPAQPGFRALTTADLPTGIPNANLANSTITYAPSISGSDISISPLTVALGGTVTVAIPSAGPGARGALTAADWTSFNNKPISVNGQTGVVVTKNADSIKSYPVDTTTNRNNYLLTFDSANHKFILSAGASAGVSSVALTAPSFLSVAGSPITSSGTIALSLANQTQNKVFASPDGSTGTPAFRAILNADLPISGVTAGTYNSVTLNAQGIATAASNVGTGITSLNGLTGATQTFATGTSGSDFNISSSGTVHTYNLPTADATHRGALSTSDWSSFTAKQAQLNGTGYIKQSTTTSSYLTPTQVTADLNPFTTSLQGLVPPSGGGTVNFMRADGTWAAPGGASPANPTATVGFAAVNGSASTFMRSDAAPAADTSGGANSLKKAFLPLDLEATKTIKQEGFSIIHTNGGVVQFDSTKYTAAYTNPLVGAVIDSLSTYGNSITFGLNATVRPDSAYVGRLSRATGIALLNKGVSGASAAATIGLNYANINPGHHSLTTFCIGFNDLRNFGNSTNSFNQIVDAYSAAVVNQYITSYVSASNVAVTRYGTGWNTNWDAAGNAKGKTTSGAYNSVANDSAVTSVTGSAIGIGMIGQPGSGASCVVYVDNVKVDSFSMAQQAATATYTPMAKAYTGFSSGAHTVKLVNSGGSGLFIVDYIAALSTTLTQPFVAIDIPYLYFLGGAVASQSSKAKTDTVNNRLSNLMTAFKAQGFNVYHAITNNYYTGTLNVDLSSDSIHPNNLGHSRIYQSISAALSSASFSNGTLVFSNDAHFYGSQNGINQQIAYKQEMNLQTILVNGATLNTASGIYGSSTSFEMGNFSKLNIDSILFVTKSTKTVNVVGALQTSGASAGLLIGQRNGDTTKGHTFFGSNALLFRYDNYNTRAYAAEDTSMRTKLYNTPSNTSYNNLVPASTLEIGGNILGRALFAPLKIRGGVLMATPEADAIENDSTHLYYTNKTGTRYQLDQQSGTAAPFSDATAIIKNSSDATKLLKFDVSGFTTGTTRTWIWPNASGTVTGIATTQTLTNKTYQEPALQGHITTSLTTGNNTIAAGAGAGTGASVSLTGTDIAGIITVTTGTLPSTASGIATMNYSQSYGSQPFVILSAANAAAAALNGVSQAYVDDASSSTSQFTIEAGTTALTPATTYKWYYHVIN